MSADALGGGGGSQLPVRLEMSHSHSFQLTQMAGSDSVVLGTRTPNMHGAYWLGLSGCGR